MPETQHTIKEYAKEIVNCGYALLPCYGFNAKEDKKRKVSMLREGDPDYQTGISAERFEKEFYKNEDTFVAIRCGDISQNMECLDFDNNFGDAKDIFQAYCAIPAVKAIIEEYNLFIEETISGGRHLVYLVDQPLTKLPQGKNLARRFNNEIEKPQVLIEIRTTGLYFVTYPSKGYVVKFGSLFDMKPIPLETRDFLIEMARSFEEFDDPRTYYAPPASKGRSTLPAQANELRPGDDFDNDPASIDEMIAMIKAEGWTQLSKPEKGWCRPGKSGEVSATLGYIGEKGNVFYVFSTNAYPFEAGKCYTPFRVLTLLHYNGDFSACAKSLAQRGYGTQNSPVIPKENDKNWGEAKRMARDVLKRLRKVTDVSDVDLSMIAQKANIDLLEAKAVLDKEYQNNPEFLNFDSKSNISQAVIWINKKWIVKRNVIKQTETVLLRKDPNGKEFNSDDIYLDLKENGFKTSKTDVDSILNSAHIEDFNPLHDYFTKLPVYKESDTNWIKEYASYWQCDDPKMQPFWERMFEKHLVRSLHCALRGIENRYCLVLLGRQEAGKSTYIRNLCFDEAYYTQKDMFSSGDSKDNLIAQFENFFWNLEEIDGYSNANLNRMKAAISMPYDKVRDVFGRKSKMRVRIVTYWATGNKDNILTDETGNSRFLVFRGRIISHDYNNHKTKVCTVPLDNLWSQVYYLYQKGEQFQYDLTSEDKKERDSNNTKYEVGNDTESTILDMFDAGYEFWSVTRMARHMRKQSGGSIFTGQQIITAMKRIIDNALCDFRQAEYGGQKGFYVSCKTDDNGHPLVPPPTRPSPEPSKDVDELPF